MNDRDHVALGFTPRRPATGAGGRGPVLLSTNGVDRASDSRVTVPGASRDQHDALERALADCLWAFAELARSAGHADRCIRLRSAAELLQRDCPPGPAAVRVETAIRLEAAGPLPRPPVGRSLRKPWTLTGREQEVARLIAQGYTNRQIADHLRISERTADTHVQNILNRLGLVSRAQVAAWVVERSDRGPSS